MSQRFTGVVREVKRAPRKWKVEVEGSTFEGADDGMAVVEIDGLPVEVGIDREGLLGAAGKRKGAWSEVRERFGLPAGTIPPFVEAEVEEVTLQVGDPVAIAGEVTARAFEDDGGLRDAPTARIRRVRARVFGIGAGAEARVSAELASREQVRAATAASLAPRKPAAPPPRSWYEPVLERVLALTLVDVVDLVVAAIAVVLLVIAGVADADARPRIAFACAVIALTVGLRPGARLVDFRAREKPHAHGGNLAVVSRGVALGFGLMPVVMGFAIATGDLESGEGGERHGAPVIAAYGLFAIGLMAAGDWMARRTVRSLGLLARDGIEGVARAKKPVKLGGQPCVLGVVEGWQSYTRDGKSGTRTLYERYQAVTSFTIETADGGVTVDPVETAWATTHRRKHDGREGGADWQMVEAIPVDRPVVAHGAREEGKLRARGTEAVYLLAAGDHPRRWAARMVRWRWFTRIVLVASAAGLLWASGWIL